MEELKYQKKYALMPLEEFVGYDKITGERVIRPYAYIVSECYLIDKEQIKLSYKKVKNIYKVVFTQDQFSNQNIEPQYTPNGYCINANTVDRIFDNIEEALIYREFRNNDLRISLMMKCNIEDVYQVESNFLEKLEYAYKIEEKNLSNNKLKIKEHKKLKK